MICKPYCLAGELTYLLEHGGLRAHNDAMQFEAFIAATDKQVSECVVRQTKEPDNGTHFVVSQTSEICELVVLSYNSTMSMI